MIVKESIAGRDIAITLPSKVSWDNYKKELHQVKDGENVLNFKVPNFPKDTKVGDRCYLVYNGKIVGWMKIVGFSEKDFTCTTTGKRWKGKFIERSGPFHPIKPIPTKGFRGFKYMDTIEK